MAGKGGGGAWKVAYADFVTAMMAFFMVMWITAQSQEMKESIAHHFSDPFGANDSNGKSGGVDSSGPPFNINENKRVSIRPKILVQQDDRKLFQLGTTVYFKNTSIELDDQNLGALELLVPDLRWNATQIEIIGYADSNASKKAGISPWLLAHQRCLAIKEIIESLGVPVDKVQMTQGIATAELDSAGNPQPSDQSSADRVEIRIPRKSEDDTRDLKLKRGE